MVQPVLLPRHLLNLYILGGMLLLIWAFLGGTSGVQELLAVMECHSTVNGLVFVFHVCDSNHSKKCVTINKQLKYPIPNGKFYQMPTRQ